MTVSVKINIFIDNICKVKKPARRINFIDTWFYYIVYYS